MGQTCNKGPRFELEAHGQRPIPPVPPGHPAKHVVKESVSVTHQHLSKV